jgi:hypothetical protein
MKDIADIVHSHLTKKGPPTFGPVMANLVELGIARLREDFMGDISEPLALVSLVRWFHDQPGFSLENGIRSRLADPASRGSAFEELMVFYFTKKFRQPTCINEVFQFYGTQPDWASQTAQLVCSVHGSYKPVDLDTREPLIPATGVARYASSPNEVIQWLEDPSAGWCLPGDMGGPDLLAWLSLSSGKRVLLMVQEKSYLSGNRHTVFAKTAAEAVHSLTTDRLFHTSVCSFPFVCCLALMYDSSPLSNVNDCWIPSVNSMFSVLLQHIHYVSTSKRSLNSWLMNCPISEMPRWLLCKSIRF